ncbi:D-2-hydroxyacid dehydrogenase [Paenibacillus aurantius]|uniref:D-2-hydroxyacid dehydrogenase n=1 Tax=Paenibacillus aurantius TaxID=2918900 RepID=A0AA96LFL5_9BACL|nr:D-2-hydroxyacid dehydrogenase [Paenibacillus aurantius]WNQ12153.1 D-2-hydroxyacid dehydrogenase [Paenibacillus aurantius]
MKIVILDGYTLNPGDLSWTKLEQLGDLTVYDRTPEDLITERAQGAEIVLTNKTPLNAETISRLPGLKYIGVLATGYNIIDLEAAKARNLIVTNVPAYSTDSVAQLTFSLLLELVQQVARHSEAARSGQWAQSQDFSFALAPLTELAGKTIGLVGYGDIGKRTARIARAFGMRVLASTSGRRAYPDELEVTFASLHDLLAESDIVSLHCPLTPETKGLINEESIARMKPGAVLINTSRGGLVVEEDLAQALRDGKMAGAGVDVLSTEPPAADNPLLSAPNCVVTPHIAWASVEARRRLMDIAVDNVRNFQNGQPVHVVNG